MPKAQTSDEVFNEHHYARQGIQPSTGRRPIINVKTETRRGDTVKQRGINYALAGDRQTAQQQYDAELANKSERDSTDTSTPPRLNDNEQVVRPLSQARLRAVSGTGPEPIIGQEEHSKQNASREDRLRSTQTSFRIATVGLGIWLSTIWAPILVIAGLSAISLLEGILKFFEWIFDPYIILSIAMFLTMSIGWITLVMTYFMYKSKHIEPLFGHNSDLKMTLVITATIMYMIPVASIFPWFILWVLVVWRNPK